MTGEMQRDLGRAEGRLAGLERSLTEIQASLANQNEQLRSIHDKLSETKGAWRMLIGVGTVAGAVGATLVKVLPALAMFR